MNRKFQQADTTFNSRFKSFVHTRNFKRFSLQLLPIRTAYSTQLHKHTPWWTACIARPFLGRFRRQTCALVFWFHIVPSRSAKKKRHVSVVLAREERQAHYCFQFLQSSRRTGVDTTYVGEWLARSLDAAGPAGHVVF